MPMCDHVYFEETGVGEPLVLIHGHTLDHRMWREAIIALAQRYRVITPDLAGHGKSGLPTDGRPFAADLAALLDHLALPSAHVGGHSMGGAMAISFALHYPERTRTLLAVDAALFGRRFDQWAGPRPYAQKARSSGLHPALQAWLHDQLFAPALASPARADVEQIVFDYPGLAWLGPTPSPYPPGPPEADRLHEINAPTLVLVGEHDLPDFHRIADRLAREIPHAGRVVVSAAGHLLPMEQPNAFATAVLAFLEAHA